jgi:hypothetical protein
VRHNRKGKDLGELLMAARTSNGDGSDLPDIQALLDELSSGHGVRPQEPEEADEGPGQEAG